MEVWVIISKSKIVYIKQGFFDNESDCQKRCNQLARHTKKEYKPKQLHKGELECRRSGQSMNAFK